jgi:hypothetical protein
MFHSFVKSKKFNKQAKVLKKEQEAEKLKEPTHFCTLDDAGKGFLRDTEIQVLGSSLAHDPARKEAWVEFKRPLVESGDNAMDLEAG